MTRAHIEITAEARQDMVQVIGDKLRNVLIVAGWPHGEPMQVSTLSIKDAFSTIVDLALRINIAIGQAITSMDILPFGIAPGTTFDPLTMDDTFASSRNSAAVSTVGGDHIVGTTDMGFKMTLIGFDNAAVDRVFLKPKVVLESAIRGGRLR
jgi:hypothetical protein